MNKKDKAASVSGYLKGINSMNPLVYPAHKKNIFFKLKGIIWTWETGFTQSTFGGGGKKNPRKI